MSALEGLGFRPQAPVKTEDFADPSIRRSWSVEEGMVVFSLWCPTIPGFSVDFFVDEPIPFEEAFERAVKVRLGSVEVLVASLEDLIAMKRKSGRLVDLEDIRKLGAISRLRQESENA